MKIPYFCCIGAELKRYEKDFDFMNQVYLYKVPTDDTINEVFAQDYFKAISDTVLQDDIVYIYETASQKIHVCHFDKENGHITAVKLASGIPELEPGKILVGDQNGNIASSDLSIEYIKDTLSILHCTAQLSNTVDTTTVVMLDELDAFETLDSRPSYKAPGAIVVDNFGNRGIIESVDQENQTAVIVTIYTAVKSVNGKTGDAVLTGEDISADVSEQTDTVQGHLQTLHDNIKDIELFKFPNATIVGEPTINHGQVSGFSANNYLQFPTILDLHNKPFVIDFCFTTGTDVNTQQNILDSQFGIALAIANGKGLMAISHNGTSWAGSIVGTLDIQPNTTYYARLSWNRMNYQTQLSTDGTTYTPDMNFGSTQSPYPRTMFIGGCSGSAIGHTPHPFGGTINMNYAYLTVDGQIVWQGMDDAGLATRMDIDAGNISDAGKERIKQIVDIDSKQNKLVAGANINIDESTNEISAKDVVNYNNISNCITEIPQDIKLELNNGTLTLKAGSKVYVPNGAGVFNVVTIENDLTATNSDNDKRFIVLLNGVLATFGINNCYSGTTAPSGQQYMLWYDTANNLVKFTADSGSTWTTNNSLTLGIITSNVSQITSIDQVFNGFGYIGSTVFALPGVKGLIPNGRNADGSLKNVEIEITSVRTISGGSADQKNITCGIRDIGTLGLNGNFKYLEQENKNIDTSNTSAWNACPFCVYDNTSGKISNFAPKTVFHALDYNDSEYIAHQAMPSSRYIDLTLGASGATYTAPADGWFAVHIIQASGNTFFNIYVDYNNEQMYAETLHVGSMTGFNQGDIIPVPKNATIIFIYDGSPRVNYIRFIYAQGAQ